MKPQLLIFDLDGTLVDSQRDLVECVNATLDHCGLPPLPDDRVSGFIGNGVAALVERSLRAVTGDAHVHHAEALAFFLGYYREHLLDHTRTYPGVLDAVTALRNLPQPPHMAVLTNKPVNPSRQICKALGLAPSFFAIYGGNSFATKKPDPEGLRVIWRQAEDLLGEKIQASQVAMIGDSEVDVRTARSAGVLAWGCTWGFARAKMLAESPDAIAHSPDNWLALSQQVRQPGVPAGRTPPRARP